MTAEITRLQKCCDEQCERITRAMRTNNPLLLVDALARQQVYSDELRIETERWEAAQRRANETLVQQVFRQEKRRMINAKLDGAMPVEINASLT